MVSVYSPKKEQACEGKTDITEIRIKNYIWEVKNSWVTH